MDKTQLAHLGKAAGVGLFQTLAPQIVKGLINEALKKVTIYDVEDAVVENKDLWALLGPENEKKIRLQVSRIPGERFEWFTSGWLLESVKGQHPHIVSYVKSWKKAQTWLDRQILKARKELGLI